MFRQITILRIIRTFGLIVFGTTFSGMTILFTLVSTIILITIQTIIMEGIDTDLTITITDTMV